MKISTGLYPSVGRGERPGEYKVYFHEPEGERIQAVHVMLVTKEPQINRKGFTLVLYRDQPDYNVERDKDAREYHGIPEDATVDDHQEETEYGASPRTFTWYEVIV